MSTCISSHGEYSEHEPGDWCPRCWAFNEEAIVAERDELRRTVGELTSALNDAVLHESEARDALARQTPRLLKVEAERNALAAKLDRVLKPLAIIAAADRTVRLILDGDGGGR